MGELTLVLGGVRSGKSRFAERLAARCPDVTYLATGRNTDEEMADRIARHRASRPAHWRTVEEPLHPAAALTDAGIGVAGTGAGPGADAPAPGRSVVLLDCISFLVTNHLLQGEATCEDAVTAELAALCDLSADLIVVSNEVGMGVVPAYKSGRLFRDILGRANQYLAARAEKVYVCWAGIPVDIKQLGSNAE